MTLNEMKKKKRELGYSNEQVAELSGVPLGTVQKIFGGATTAPRYRTLQKLEAIFTVPASVSDHTDTAEPEEAWHLPEKSRPAYDRKPMPGVLREPFAAYGTARQKAKKQGEFTVEDYYSLPDGKRYELIDGVLFEMEGPGYIHQGILQELHLSFGNFLRKKNGTCRVFIAPCDVQLDKDDKTMVEPDLIVICDRDKIRRKVCYGAPDFILEVLSPSTRRKDLFVKTGKYAEADVREYWVIDPDKRQVLVFDFEHDELPKIYGPDAKVPVGIWNGELVIDFADVWEQVSYLYEKVTD